jgi:hypothetical protein
MAKQSPCEGGGARFVRLAPVPGAPESQENSRTLAIALAVAGLGIVLGWLARTLTTPYRDPNNPAHTVPRATRDDYEMSIYWKRGAWEPTGLRPYLDVFSEYPPLATWMFGLPFAAIDLEPAPPKTMLQNINAASPNDPATLRYGNIWAAAMVFVWFGVAGITAVLARALGSRPWVCWLCLGPAALYCAIQRFDPLPALAVSCALLCFVRGRGILGFVLLACGAMIKIYPAVLAPLAFGYVWRTAGLRSALFGAGAFAGVIGLAELPPLLAGFRDPSWDGKPRGSLEGGLAAVKVPFSYQGERDTNPGSLAERFFRGWLGVSYESLLQGLKAFRVLQFAPALFAVAIGWFRPRPAALCAASAALVTTFVLFHNIYSPQFQCWIVPLAALAAGGRAGLVVLGLAFAADVVTYVQFPILSSQARFDPATQRNVFPALFTTIIDLRIVLTAALCGLLWWQALAAKPAETAAAHN